jgi:hypothetical protein
MNANRGVMGNGINSGTGQGFGGDIGGFMTPNPLLLPPVSSGGIGGQQEVTQSQLRPLQSLDARVLKQFRALEQKDPRFKRRVVRNSNQFNGPNSNPVNQFMTRFISPGGTEYNYSQI